MAPTTPLILTATIRFVTLKVNDRYGLVSTVIRVFPRLATHSLPKRAISAKAERCLIFIVISLPPVRRTYLRGFFGCDVRGENASRADNQVARDRDR